MNVVHFLIKDIFRKKLRVLLTVGGVGIGIFLCVIMLGIGDSIKRSFRDVYGKRQIDIIVQEKDQMSILLSRLDARFSQKIQGISGVEHTAATLLYLHKVKRVAVPIFGWEPDSFLFDTVEMVKGASPVKGKKEAMVGEGLARTLEKDGQKSIVIKGVSFLVVGEFKSSSPFEQSAAVIPLEDLQSAIREDGKATFINVKLQPAYRTQGAIENTIENIEGRLPSIAAMRTDAFVSEKTKFIVVGEQFSILVSLITIIAVALGLANTMVTSGFEKRKFLAILMALGWQKREVASLFILESVFVACLGGALGIFLGFKGTGYIFGMTSISAFSPELSVLFIVRIAGMVLGSAVVAAIVPTCIMLNANPVEVIRGE